MEGMEKRNEIPSAIYNMSTCCSVSKHNLGYIQLKFCYALEKNTKSEKCSEYKPYR